MNARSIRYVAVMTLLAPCLAAAQQPAGKTPGDGEAALAQRRTAAPSKGMDEDVEIMRRLLDGNLRSIYGIPPLGESGCLAGYDVNNRINLKKAFLNTNAPYDGFVRSYLGKTYANDPNSSLGAYYHFLGTSQNSDPHGNLWPLVAEGTYLPGYGVVYAMTLPPPSQPSSTESAKPVGKSLSDWERTRKELRGEKIEADPPAEQRPPSVSGTILKVLADNGHQFTALKSDEVISVAITFRHKWSQFNPQCMVCHSIGPGTGPSDTAAGAPSSTPGSGGLGQGASSGEGGGPAGRANPSGPNSAGTPNTPQAAGSDSTRRGDFWSKVEDRVLLGDLHVKQGRHKEALDAYGKAAETLEHYVNNTWHWDKEQVKASRELYGKLIQVHLAMGDNEGARKVMAKVEKIPAPRLPVEVTLNQSAPAKQAATPLATLPAKLIVTATKQQLDQVASGKITFEDFKKAAKVAHHQPSETAASRAP